MELDGKRFIFTLISDITQDVDSVQAADDDTAAMLRRFYHHRDDTLLVLVGGHGPRWDVSQDIKDRVNGNILGT